MAAQWLALQNQPTPLPFRYARYTGPHAAEARYHEALMAAGYLDDRDAPEDWEPPPEAGLTPIAPPSAQPSATLTGMLEGWWTEAKATGRKPSTYESYRNTIAGLVEFLV